MHSGKGSEQKPRRIVDLTVDEVSDVDLPAIRRTFLIVKSLLENGDMGVFDSDDGHEVDQAEFDAMSKEVTKALEANGFEFSEIDVEKALPPDLAAALKATTPWMRRMAGQAEGDTRKAILRVVAFLSKVSSGQYPSPKAAQKKPEDEDEDEKGKKAQKKPEDEDEDKKGKGKSKTKSLDEDDDSMVTIKVDQNGQAHVITKGRRLTTSRVDAIASSAEGMLGLLKEADVERFKALMEAISKELPGDLKWRQGVTAVGTKKGEEQDSEVMKALGDIGKRLETIEKSRAPSTSVDEDGDTDGKDKKKTEKSFWGNVL